MAIPEHVGLCQSPSLLLASGGLCVRPMHAWEADAALSLNSKAIQHVFFLGFEAPNKDHEPSGYEYDMNLNWRSVGGHDLGIKHWFPS